MMGRSMQFPPRRIRRRLEISCFISAACLLLSGYATSPMIAEAIIADTPQDAVSGQREAQIPRVDWAYEPFRKRMKKTADLHAVTKEVRMLQSQSVDLQSCSTVKVGNHTDILPSCHQGDGHGAPQRV